ncbi:hypothetical protein GOODEAATRI_013625 [Goodea atripinnis]|uniref:Uncharacterized protein n=1 Tax=Goodea atripinnis TaxID=208336 RepID=A0ABV0P424_9TELE
MGCLCDYCGVSLCQPQSYSSQQPDEFSNFYFSSFKLSSQRVAFINLRHFNADKLTSLMTRMDQQKKLFNISSFLLLLDPEPSPSQTTCDITDSENSPQAIELVSPFR